MKLVLFFHVKLETSFLYLIMFMTKKKKNAPITRCLGSSRDIFSFLICLFAFFLHCKIISFSGFIVYIYVFE